MYIITLKSFFLGRYGDAVNTIGVGAFAGLGSLDNATLCRGWTFIRDGAFSECSVLSGIVIPDGVSSIGEQAFSNCPSLPSIVLPSSVTMIEAYAFDTTSSLSHLILKSVVPPTLSNLNAFSMSAAQMYVPDASVKDCKSASVWSSLASRIHPLSDLGLS